MPSGMSWKAEIPKSAVCLKSALPSTWSSTSDLHETRSPPRGRSQTKKSDHWSTRYDPEIREDLAEALRQVVGENQTDPPATTRQVEVRELAAIAGGGAMVMDETVIGYVLFQRNWLDRHGLDPTQCTVINVMGESMEPTLPDGSKILVDRSQRRPRHGRIFVVRASDGLVVKRVEENEAGSWTLKSDQQEHESAPWGDSEIIGEVRWIGITL